MYLNFHAKFQNSLEFFCRRETTAYNNHRDEASDLESTVETEPCTRSRAPKTPSNDELEEFFAVAERDLLHRFAVR